MRGFTRKERFECRFHIGMAKVWNKVANAYTKGVIYHSRKGHNAADAEACAKTMVWASKKFLKHMSKVCNISSRCLES